MKYSIIECDIVSKGKWPKSKKAALNESIRKWEWLVGELEGMDLDGATPFPVPDHESCALCYIYMPFSAPSSFDECRGCPVFEKTSKKYCKGTPYYRFLEVMDNFSSSRSRANLREAINTAKSEVKFLQSLL